MIGVCLFFECYGDHRDLHVRTHSFPTRRSSDLPLTGAPDTKAVASQNLGTLKPNEDMSDAELIQAAVPARCDERGFLLIGNPPELGPYVLPGNNYHVYDYSLFWANVRADAKERLTTFLAR